MSRKQRSVRLREDQERQLELMIEVDPEMDRSKLIRKAVDEYLVNRVSEQPGPFKAKKRVTGENAVMIPKKTPPVPPAAAHAKRGKDVRDDRRSNVK